MTISITKAQLASFDPCDFDARMKLFGERKSLSIRQAFKAGASVKDMLWVAGKLGLKREMVQFALLSAQRVAHLNPDPRVQAAINAAQAWVDDPSEANRALARNAADAAYAAAYAAYAAARAARSAAMAKARADEEAAQRKLFIKVFGNVKLA